MIKQSDLNEETKQELIKVMLLIKDNSIMLRATADKLLFNQSDIESVETSLDKELLPFKVAEVRGKKFLASFAEELRKR
jgi:hypothetical protein